MAKKRREQSTMESNTTSFYVPIWMSTEVLLAALRALRDAGNDLDQAATLFQEHLVAHPEELHEVLKYIVAEVIRTRIWENI